MPSSVGSMAPPGGRGAPPGGTEPPGGRSAPGGRPPRLSIGQQGRGFRRPRLPATMGGKLHPGQKQVVKTTVRGNRALLREEIQKHVKEHPYPRTGTTEPQDAYSAPKRMGKGSAPRPRGLRRGKAPRPQVAAAGQAAAAAQAGQATAPKQAANQPIPKVKKRKPRAPKAAPEPEESGQYSMEGVMANAPPRTAGDEERHEALEASLKKQQEDADRIQAMRDAIQGTGSPGHKQGGDTP
jgi:hypothetical protein